MIDAYLRELRRALGRRLPPAVLAARLREAEGHLRMAAAEFGDAEAMRRYGSARNAAHAVVRSHRGYATTSSWRLSWGVAILLFVGLAVPYAWLDVASKANSPEGLNAAMTAVVWLPFLALLAFAVRALQTRRWIVGGAWVAFVAAVGTVLVVGMAAPVSPNRATPENVAGARSDLAFWRTAARDVNAWRLGQYPERAPQPSMESGVFMAPMIPVGIPLGSRPGGMGLSDGDELGRRKELWARNGAAWATTVAQKTIEAEATLRDFDRPVQRPPLSTALPHVAALFFGGAAYGGLVLTLVNAAALGLAAASDRRRMRRT